MGTDAPKSVGGRVHMERRPCPRSRRILSISDGLFEGSVKVLVQFWENKFLLCMHKCLQSFSRWHLQRESVHGVKWPFEATKMLKYRKVKNSPYVCIESCKKV